MRGDTVCRLGICSLLILDDKPGYYCIHIDK